MKKLLQRFWFPGVLGASACLAAALPLLAGGDYYLRCLAHSPFHPLFHLLKPSGPVGHFYGIIGSGLILVGVIVYSTRKRVRLFASLGTMKHFLEFHIAVCLVGPILIAYHATFKLGGIVGVGFWSMMAVVISGFIGRYLWVQIPKGIEGQALSIKELETENARLLTLLKEHHEFSPAQTLALDRLIDATMPSRGTSLRALRAVVWHDVRLFFRRRALSAWLSANGVYIDQVSACVSIAGRRSILHRRILFLEQLQSAFQHWHVIHLPFTVVLLIIFLVHVAASVLFGYVWGG